MTVDHDPETGEVLEGEPVGIVPASQGWLAMSASDPVGALVSQRAMVLQVCKEVMREGVHFGTIPGTPKPSLWKAGAELLDVLFRLAPKYEVQSERWEGAHLFVRYRCTLVHIPTGQVWGEGIGSCSTMESKYRYRGGKRSCPSCEKPGTIIQTKKGRNPGGYWCVPDKGGCGANFNKGDQQIEGQQVGQVENPDLADTYNVVDKMACKRALVAAALNVSGVSDVFTQDMEDFHPYEPTAVRSVPEGQKGAQASKDAPRATNATSPAPEVMPECPTCHKAAIRFNPTGDPENYAYCWKRAGGCGKPYTKKVWDIVSVPGPSSLDPLPPVARHEAPADVQSLTDESELPF